MIVDERVVTEGASQAPSAVVGPLVDDLEPMEAVAAGVARLDELADEEMEGDEA